MAKTPRKPAPKGPLPQAVLTGIKPDALLKVDVGQRATQLLRGYFRLGATVEAIAGIPPMVLYAAVRDGLVPAAPVVEKALRTQETTLVTLATLLPLMADPEGRDKLLASILSRVGGYSVKADDYDLAQVLSVLWPQLENDTQKQLFLSALRKYIKRKARSASSDIGSPLLIQIAQLEPAWYPSLVELALQIPSRPDLFVLLREGEDALVDHLLARPEFAGMGEHPGMWVLAVDRFFRDPDFSLRLLDALPHVAKTLANKLNTFTYKRSGLADPELAPRLMAAWLDSRAPEKVLRQLSALKIAYTHPAMSDALCTAVISRLCTDKAVAFQSLSHEDFFRRLSPEQVQLLLEASRDERNKIVEDCLKAAPPIDVAMPVGARRSSNNNQLPMQVLAARYTDLPQAHPGRRILAVDLIGALLGLESVSPRVFPAVDRTLADRFSTTGDSFLATLLQTWVGSSAQEVKTIWRALSPKDAETATGLIDGLLANTPKMLIAPESSQTTL